MQHWLDSQRTRTDNHSVSYNNRQRKWHCSLINKARSAAWQSLGHISAEVKPAIISSHRIHSEWLKMCCDLDHKTLCESVLSRKKKKDCIGLKCIKQPWHTTLCSCANTDCLCSKGDNRFGFWLKQQPQHFVKIFLEWTDIKFYGLWLGLYTFIASWGILMEWSHR